MLFHAQRHPPDTCSFRATAIAAAVLLTIWTSWCAVPLGASTPPLLDDLSVESLTISNIDTDGIEMTLSLSAVARATATLEYLIVEEMTLGDIHFVLPVIPGPLRLHDGEAVQGLSQVKARLAYRQLESMDPLRSIIADGKARVRGTLRGRVALTFLQKLMAMTTGAWVVARIDRDVTIALPGGPLGRTAAAAALGFAEPIWTAGRSLQMQGNAELLARAREEMSPWLVSVETRYDMRARDGRISRHRHVASGFLAHREVVLAPAEAAEPWLFDENVAEAIQKGDARVLSASVDITIDPLALGVETPRPFHPSRLVRTLGGTVTAVSPQTKRRFPLRLRDDNGNAAFFGVTEHPGSGARLNTSVPDSQWHAAVIVRTREVNDTTQLSYTPTAVRWTGRRYELQDAFDRDAFGSPIWTDAGIVGMVQSATSGIAMRQLEPTLERLRRRP